MTVPKVFICYRREDSKWPAQLIYNDLTNHFGSGSVVFDVDTIPPGIDFREYLYKEVSKCDILLAIIGDQWLGILERRLGEPNDFVRIEIQAALERQIPVVPILVGKASVPNEKDLPPKLAGLAYMQAAEVHAGPDLQNHLKRLVSGLDRLLAQRKAEEEQRRLEEEAKRFTEQEHKLREVERVRKEEVFRKAIQQTLSCPIIGAALKRSGFTDQDDLAEVQELELSDTDITNELVKHLHTLTG